MVKKKVTVINPSGLHLRPAGLLCQTAEKYLSQITILFGDSTVNAKSVLNVMASGIRCGSKIEVCCEGSDEAEALEAVCTLIEKELKE